MTCSQEKSLAKACLLILGAVVLSLTSLDATMAHPRTSSGVKVAATNQHFARAVRNNNAAKRAWLRIVREVKTNPKFSKLISRGCNCAPDLTGGFGACLKNCLVQANVNPTTALSCAVICTSNYVGCAVCAGVQEWILAACVQYCAWYPVFNRDTALQFHRSRSRGLQQARLRIPAVTTS